MEEVKFKNTSKMNAEEISIFQSYAMKKTIWGFAALFTLLFAGCGVGLIFVNMTLGIVLIVCGVAGGLFFLPYLLKENQKRQNMQQLGQGKYINTFSFFENHILVESQATNGIDNRYQPVGEEMIKYQDVYKVVSYKDRLFLFLDKTQSLILSFAGMTTGTIAELAKFLKEKGIEFVDKSHIDVDIKKNTKKAR